MKKILTSYIIALITVALTTGCPSTSGVGVSKPSPPSSWRNPLGKPTYTVYVKGLVCPSCAVGLKKALMKLPFVGSIHVNYNTGITHIYEVHERVDHKGIRKFDKSRITKAIKDSGYEVDKFKEK